MNDGAVPASLTAEEFETLLRVTRALAAPFELHAMLAEINAEASQLLHAERSSVWLLDEAANELVLEVSGDITAVRRAAGQGLIGACAASRSLINVPDCGADPRFDPSLDHATGFHTRCSLTLPLIRHDGALIGVLQLLNRRTGVFDAADERLAQALAAQCAVALSRIRETQAMVESARLRHQLDSARLVQQASLPHALPQVEGYELHVAFVPAEQTGGDTYDLARVGDELLVVLADASGHGIAAALAVTQMQAMLRTALRCGASLEAAFRHVNDQLAETLREGSFVTAFVGLLHPRTHRLRFVSAGQAPILRLRAREEAFDAYKATGLPLGVKALDAWPTPVELLLEPGDVLLLLSDGVYECQDATGQAFGRPAVERLAGQWQSQGAGAIAQRLLEGLRRFAGDAAPQDDVTMVVVRRLPATAAPPSLQLRFATDFQALAAAQATVREHLAAAAVDERCIDQLDVVLEELGGNVVRHARPADGVMRLAVEVRSDGVFATLEDSGPAFDPTAAPLAPLAATLAEADPGGWGLRVIRRMTQTLEYRRADGCNRITAGLRRR